MQLINFIRIRMNEGYQKSIYKKFSLQKVYIDTLHNILELSHGSLRFAKDVIYSSFRLFRDDLW